MSDHIPFEIQAQIMKYLPVKSLIQFRSVSKQWKSLIETSEFISNHNPLNPEPQHLLVSYFDTEKNKNKYVSFLDDKTFPQHKIFPTVPDSVNLLINPKVIGSSKGVFCFHSSYVETAVLWNPRDGKSVVVTLPNVLYRLNKTIVGFAICPRTNDPKLVNVTFIRSEGDYDICISQVEVFSLSTGVWRTLSIDLPGKSIQLIDNQEVIDGVIYWLSIDRVVVDNVHQVNFLIMSFNITTEEFTKVCLPDYLSLDSDISLSISKLRENIVVLEHDLDEKEHGYHVWIMDNGVEKSFTKIFTISPPNGLIERVLGFRFSGEPIVGVLDDTDDPDIFDYEEKQQGTLFVYQSQSKDIDSIGIYGNVYSFFVNSFTETLLLLDH